MDAIDIALLIVYIILLIFSLLYGGIISYHVLKYRTQLPQREADRSIVVLIFYWLIGGGIIVVSMIAAGISSLLII